MKERIDTLKVTVSVKDMHKKIHLLMNDGTFSPDYSSYDTIEDALENMCHFMLKIYRKNCSNADTILFEKEPYIYEVIDEKRSVSVHRIVISSKSISCFLLDSFKEYSLNDIACFIKDYCESDCAKDFTTISFIPRANSGVTNDQVLDYGFIYLIDEIKSLTIEELKEKISGTKIIGYMYL